MAFLTLLPSWDYLDKTMEGVTSLAQPSLSIYRQLMVAVARREFFLSGVVRGK